MPNPFDPQVLLGGAHMAFLASLAKDGAPCTSPVWYIWEDDALWMLGSTKSSSVGRLSSDARCSVEIVDFENEVGRLLHLGMRGRADIVPCDAERFRRLLDKYLGARESWNPWFIENIACIDDPEGRMIKLVPDSFFTNNVSYFRTGPDVLDP